jgi:hypothetical protein
MDIRNYVTFEASCRDDAEWDGAGNLLIPGGRSVAEILSVELYRKGFTCAALSQHSFYGWRFNAIELQGKEVVSCLLQSGGYGAQSWLLICDQKDSIIRKLLGSNERNILPRVVNALDKIFEEHRLFSNHRWYTASDYETGRTDLGAASPS